MARRLTYRKQSREALARRNFGRFWRQMLLVAYEFIFSPPGAHALCSPYWLTASRYAICESTHLVNGKTKMLSVAQSKVTSICDNYVQKWSGDNLVEPARAISIVDGLVSVTQQEWGVGRNESAQTRFQS